MNLKNIQWKKAKYTVFLKEFLLFLACLLGIIYFAQYDAEERDSKALSRIEALQTQLKTDKIELDKAQKQYDKTLNNLLIEQNIYINKAK